MHSYTDLGRTAPLVERRTILGLLAASTVPLAGCTDGQTMEAGSQSTDFPTDAPGAGDEATETTTEGPGTPGEGTETPTEGYADAIEGAGLVTVEGEDTVEATVERIQSAAEEGPVSVLTTIDHAENAASVDRDLPPTTLLLVGNPDVGTPLMAESRSIAIDLPQKVLVWEDEDGRIRVTYNDPHYLAARHGIEGQEERIENVATALEELATGDGN